MNPLGVSEGKQVEMVVQPFTVPATRSNLCDWRRARVRAATYGAVRHALSMAIVVMILVHALT